MFERLEKKNITNIKLKLPTTQETVVEEVAEVVETHTITLKLTVQSQGCGCGGGGSSEVDVLREVEADSPWGDGDRITSADLLGDDIIVD
tara:strand:+ start:5199 stop:5468 length:270 start_codon:yes stop_codon:yes gene_type:complete